MVQFINTFALILSAGMAMGPDDPVGISDARVEGDPGPRQVSMAAERWKTLRAAAEHEPAVVKAPHPWTAQRQVRLERSDEGIRIRVSWELETIEAGWWAGPLVGPMSGMRVESVTWRGRTIGITHTPAGEEVALKMAAESHGELKLVVFIPIEQLPGGIDGNLDLWLTPAVRGDLRLGKTPAPEGRVAELIADGQTRRMIDGRFWAGEAQLTLAWADANDDATSTQGPLAVAHSAVGLTFGEGEARGRARVSWLVRRGQLDSLSLDTAGLGRDLEVTGPNVHEWSRNGDRIDIKLKEAVDGRVDIDLRWTQGISSGAEAKLASPRITPQQVYRTESFMQIARDGELEILPKLSGWAAVARAELPDWAGGYIQGTATATFRRDGDDRSASFDLLRFVPLSGPPVVVDVAAYEIATTDEGRSLVQARYDVRNERSSHLRLVLPTGSRMLGVRVNGETVTPARDAGSAQAQTEAWRIPIVRSLESVTGTLSFPVEVIFITEADPWEKKEVRELALPTIDAPVAVSRVRVYLPPRYDNRVEEGDFHRVDDFSEGEGITYGLGVGAGAAEVSRADELYREALSGWMENDFRQVQSSLDQLGSLGASNANIEGLQANLNLVQGLEDGKREKNSNDGQSAVVSRRIRDQAKMRAADDKIELLEKAKEADELEAQGRYDQAQERLAEAQELGDRLAMLEQSESKEQQVYNQSLSSSSARIAKKKKGKVKRESAASTPAPSYKFEDDTIALGSNLDIEEGEVLIADPTSKFAEVPPELIISVENADEDVWYAPEEPVMVPQATVPTTTWDNEVTTLDPTPSAGAGLANGLRGEVIDDDSRDFTTFADAEPESEPEPDMAMAMDGRPGLRSREAKRRPARKSRGGGKKNRASETSASPSNAPAPPPAPPPPRDQNAALAGPVATASAVSVHIPAIGEAVLYQHMLLPEGKILTVHLEARRHKQSKSK